MNSLSYCLLGRFGRRNLAGRPLFILLKVLVTQHVTGSWNESTCFDVNSGVDLGGFGSGIDTYVPLSSRVNFGIKGGEH